MHRTGTNNTRCEVSHLYCCSTHWHSPTYKLQTNEHHGREVISRIYLSYAKRSYYSFITLIIPTVKINGCVHLLFCNPRNRHVFSGGRIDVIILHGQYMLFPCWLEAMVAPHPAVKKVISVPFSDVVLFHAIGICIIK